MTKDNVIHVQPARYLQNILDPAAQDLTFHQANPCAQLDGRVPHTSNGSCVGGGSSVNGTLVLLWPRGIIRGTI